MNLLRGFLCSVPSSRGCGCTLMLKSDRDLMYSKLYCMKGTWKVLERASTRSAVAGVTGPNTPATPGRIRSHSDLLALKLSSEGYLRQQHPQTWLTCLMEPHLCLSADTRERVRMDLSSLTAVTARMKAASWAPDSVSNRPAETNIFQMH